MDKINSTDRAKNEEVLQRVKQEGNILHTIQRRNDYMISHILRRNYLLKPLWKRRLQEG